jgi:hypothetical protein
MTASPAIRVGESVNRIAASGSATLTIPSARFDVVEDAHSRQYATPSGDRLGRTVGSSLMYAIG